MLRRHCNIIFAQTLVLCLVVCASVRADEIIRHSGSPNTRITITSVTYEEVQFKASNLNVTQKADAADVQKLKYASAAGLTNAYSLLRNGRYAEAEALFKREAGQGKDFLEEESDFGVAFTAYRQFIDTGKGGDRAISKLEEYLTAYRPKKGFHVPEALFSLGMTQIKTGAPDKAGAFFDELKGIRGTTRGILAEIGAGELHLAKGNADQASSAFNTMLLRAKNNNYTALYRQLAACRGRALVAQKRPDEAIDFLKKQTRTTQGADVAFDDFTAQMFNALGAAYEAKGDTESQWESLYSYLWTTRIFRHCRAESAEAFYKSVVLAKKLGKDEDAGKLSSILKQLYADTQWAEKVN